MKPWKQASATLCRLMNSYLVKHDGLHLIAEQVRQLLDHDTLAAALGAHHAKVLYGMGERCRVTMAVRFCCVSLPAKFCFSR